MSTHDYTDMLDEPRKGVPTYQDLERFTRLGMYDEALRLLERNPRFLTQLSRAQITRVIGVASRDSTIGASSLLSYLRENTNLETIFDDLSGNDVY